MTTNSVPAVRPCTAIHVVEAGACNVHKTQEVVRVLATRRSRARAKARRDIIEALVDVVNEQSERCATSHLRVAGTARPSGSTALLARAQARADAYAEILDTILPLVMTDATPDQLYRAVRAVAERIIADYVRVTVR